MDEQELLSVQQAWHLVEQMTVKAVLPNVPLVTACVTRAAEALAVGDHDLYQVQLAVDEACANVVDHAYLGPEPGDMEVSCYRYGRDFFIIRVRDWGQGFDPAKVAQPQVDAPLEERSLGGLGLFLVQAVMDWVKFSFDPDRGNELLMVKRLGIAD